MCQKVTGKKANVQYVGSREGDPAILVANAEKIYNEFGWKAYQDLFRIINSAYKWHSNNVYSNQLE